MKKTTPICARFQDAELAAIQTASADKDLTLTTVIRKYVLSGLEREGYLPTGYVRSTQQYWYKQRK